MKHKFILLITFLSINSYAIDSTSNSVLNTTNTSTSNANSAIGTGSAIGDNTFNSISNSSKQTPNAYAPNLTSSGDTCMGSTSAGLGIPGISLAVGSTWTDENCVMLKNSRELWNYGQHLAALAMLCSNKNNFQAIEIANASDPNAPHCPQTNVALKQGQKINININSNKNIELSYVYPIKIAAIPDVVYNTD